MRDTIIEIPRKQIMALALALLDDEYGVCSNGIDQLNELLGKAEATYIADMVKATEGRFYIGEDDAETIQEEIEHLKD